MWKTAFKKFEVIYSASKPYHFKFIKGCHPQILFGPLLNTLTHLQNNIYLKLQVSDLLV